MDPPPITLVMVQGPRKGETMVFQPGSTIRIGRVMRGNNFPIKDGGISSKHLTIESGSGKWILRDLGSSNGTALNTNILPADTPFDLHDGDTLKLGETTSILIKFEGRGGGGEEAAAAVLVESRRRNPPRRGRVLKSETENFNKVLENLELEKKENVRIKRNRRNEESTNHGLAIPKVAENQETEAKKGKGRPRGRKKNQQEEKPEEKETNLIEKEGFIIIKDEVSEGQKLNSSRNEEISARKDEVKEGEKLNSSPNEEINVRKDEMNEEEKLNSSQNEEINVRKGEEKGKESKTEVKESCDKRVEKDLEKMTLEQWFDYLEIHLPKQIVEATEEMIEGMWKKAESFQKYMAEQKKKNHCKVAVG